MGHDEQLAWERRGSLPAAIAALVAAVAALTAVILQARALNDRPDNDRGTLAVIDENGGQLVGSSAAQAISVLLLGAVLFYLYRVTRHRRPETPRYALHLALAGPLLLAIALVVNQLDVVDIADRFTSSGERTERRAEDLLDDRSVVGATIGFAGQLALAFGLVVINLNALRAGMVSRFLGIIGIITGVLFVLPLFGGPLIVQVFWLGALAAVFLNRWPGGRGPAWESGRAERWPTYAEQRGLAAAPDADAGGDAQAQAPEPEPAVAGEPAPQRPASRKRRRKRR